MGNNASVQNYRVGKTRSTHKFPTSSIWLQSTEFYESHKCYGKCLGHTCLGICSVDTTECHNKMFEYCYDSIVTAGVMCSAGPSESMIHVTPDTATISFTLSAFVECVMKAQTCRCQPCVCPYFDLPKEFCKKLERKYSFTNIFNMRGHKREEMAEEEKDTKQEEEEDSPRE